MKPEVKICGVRDAGVAALAASLGASYVGVIFAPESPRAATEEEARAVTAALKGNARPVAVFLHETASEAARKARACGFGIVQLHRRASEAEVAELKAGGFEVWTLAGGAEGDAVLFDSSHGDGEAEPRAAGCRTVFAGGVSAANLASAVARGTDVIDVSGSLERERGKKDEGLVRDFFEKAKGLGIC